MDPEPCEDLDVNLESTVMLALSRLQKRGCGGGKTQSRAVGVTCKRVASFLKANYPWVDGDVDSQVMTALLSFIKTGIVCALDNQKYLLVGGKTNKMISNCVTRVSHGPKCCCLTMLKCLLTTFPRTCCVVKTTDGTIKRLRKPLKAKLGTKPKSPQVKPKSPQPKQKSKKKNLKRACKPGKKGTRNCAQKAQNLIGTSKSAIALSVKPNTKCNYCLEFHSLPKLKKVCLTCYPIGKLNSVPVNNFSPRDEDVKCAESAIKTVEIPPKISEID